MAHSILCLVMEGFDLIATDIEFVFNDSDFSATFLKGETRNDAIPS